MSNLKILRIFLGATDDSIRLLLRLTARIAFLVLLVIFVAWPSQQLFRTPFTRS